MEKLIKLYHIYKKFYDLAMRDGRKFLRQDRYDEIKSELRKYKLIG